MPLYQPLKEKSEFRFASQYIENVLKIIASRGMTIRGFCRLSGFDPTQLYRIRTGDRLYPLNLHFLSSLAEKLDMTFDQVLYYPEVVSSRPYVYPGARKGGKSRVSKK